MLVFNNRRRRRRRAPIYVYTEPPEGVLVVHASTMKRVKNIQSPLPPPPTSLLSDCSTVLNISDYQYICVIVCVCVCEWVWVGVWVCGCAYYCDGARDRGEY